MLPGVTTHSLGDEGDRDVDQAVGRSTATALVQVVYPVSRVVSGDAGAA
jgi:hypothetical protein